MRLQQSSKILLSKYFIRQQLNVGSTLHISSDEENGCQQMAYYELSYQDITIFIFVLHAVEIQKG